MTQSGPISSRNSLKALAVFGVVVAGSLIVFNQTAVSGPKATKTKPKNTTTKVAKLTTVKSTSAAAASKSTPTTVRAPQGTTVAANPATIRAGAIANMARVPAVKLGTGRKLTASGLTELQAKLNDLKPGDVLDVESGSYAGSIIIPESVRGSENNPIVVRSRVAKGAVFSACGGQTQLGGKPCISVQSQHVTVQGFAFGQTGDAAVEMEGAYNRLFENWFEGSGSGANGGCCAIVLSPHDWRNKEWNDPNPTLLQRFNRIDKNTFTSIKNAAYAQGHGVVGTVFSHNMIVGPHGIDGDWETEAIKIGGDFANEPTNTSIQFNTILNWRGAPYTIGIKGSEVTSAYNLIEAGDLSLRIANKNRVIGNVLLDGSIIASGSGHTITGNYARTVSGPAGYGPIMAMTNLTVSNSAGNFDGVDKPFYVARFESSVVTNNTLVVTGPSHAVYFVVNSSTPFPTGITFKGNTFVRTSTGALVGGVEDFAAGNELISNSFVCTAACTGQQLPVSGNGNKLLASAPAEALSTNPSVPFQKDIVR